MNTWLPEQFQCPDNVYRPRMRWWLPGAFMTDEEIEREINWMAEMGYGGAEIIHFYPIPSRDIDPSEYSRYGFGGVEWNERMRIALKAAIPLGFKLDFTVGPLWPIATPAVMDQNDERCTQGLHVGVAAFNNSYSGAIPVPETVEAARPYKLVAVTAARKLTDGDIGKMITLELETAIDLTSLVTDNFIEVTPATEGEWCLFGFWSQTNGQMNNSIGAPVIDHYSKAAAEAVTDFWDNQLFSDPDIKALYEQNAGSLFCDSIELNATMLGGMYGANPMSVAIWSPEVLEMFRIRRGYDLTPYLPTIFVKGLYQLGAGHRTDGDSEYDFNDRVINGRIRNDFFSTLTDMFRENHLSTLKRWANGHNMKLRYQTYGMPTELTSGLAEVDIPETESLGFNDSTDGYRLQSGAVHLYDREIYSFEVGAVMGYGYKQTFTGKDYGLLWQLHRGFATGINQAVLHGMSYETATASGHFETMFKWPGMSLMGAMFSNEWGARQPNAQHSRIIIDYIARTQYLLRIGKPKVDLAIYRYHIDGIHHGMGTEVTVFERAGYTYDFVSPYLLKQANVQVGKYDGRLALAEEGPAYRAIVLDLRENMDTGEKISSDLPVETAKQLIAFAQKGLPIIVIGDTLQHVISFHGDSKAMKNQEALLKQQMSTLLSLPTVRSVKTQEEAIAALEQLNAHPAVKVDGNLPLLSARRYAESDNYYYLYNPSLEYTFEGEVMFEGEGNVYSLNAWDGSVRLMAEQNEQTKLATVNFNLSPNEAILVAFSLKFTDVLFEQEAIVLTEERRIQLNNWTLNVDSWTAGEHPTHTKHEEINIKLTELCSWTELTMLKNVSGIGRYRTSFNLESLLNGTQYALLELGEVSDTFKVIVNGQELPAANQIDRCIFIERFLHQGENILEVEVATTLNNALCEIDSKRQPQICGLIGPVSIVMKEKKK